jgi:hypothetical protein
MKVSRVKHWSCRIEDRPGGAAGVLQPLADAKVNLEFVLARRAPDDPGKGVLFVGGISGRAAEGVARAAGLAPAADVHVLRIEGDNRAGAGHAIAQAVADAGVSLRGMTASVLGAKYVCHLALDTAADAARAESALKSLASPGGSRGKAARRKRSYRR